MAEIRYPPVHFAVAPDYTGLAAALANSFSTELAGTSLVRRHFLETFDGRLEDAGRMLAADQHDHGYRLELRRLHGEHIDWSMECKTLPHTANTVDHPLLRTRLRRLIGPRALLSRLVLKVEITTYKVIGEAGKTVAEIYLERHTGAPLKACGAMVVLRMRVLRGFASLLPALTAVVSTIPQLQPLTEDFSLQLAALAGLDRPRYFSKPAIVLSAETPARTGLCDVLNTYWSVMRANEGGVIDDIDIEFLHDFRVAMRRSRSVFNDCRQILPKPQAKHLKRELTWLNRITGPQRDFDVLSDQLDDYLAQIPKLKASISVLLHERLETQRARCHRQLQTALRSERYRKFRREWSRLVTHASSDTKTPIAPLAHLVRQALARRYRRVMKSSWGKPRLHDLDALHSLRKECKKLRYGLEALQTLLPRSLVKTALIELKALQTLMGDSWDLEVQRGLLRKLRALSAVEADVRDGFTTLLTTLDKLLAKQQDRILGQTLVQLRRFRHKRNQDIYKKLLKPAHHERSGHLQHQGRSR